MAEKHAALNISVEQWGRELYLRKENLRKAVESEEITLEQYDALRGWLEQHREALEREESERNIINACSVCYYLDGYLKKGFMGI